LNFRNLRERKIENKQESNRIKNLKPLRIRKEREKVSKKEMYREQEIFEKEREKTIFEKERR
jgi:hypothetical protein